MPKTTLTLLVVLSFLGVATHGVAQITTTTTTTIMPEPSHQNLVDHYQQSHTPQQTEQCCGTFGDILDDDYNNLMED